MKATELRIGNIAKLKMAGDGVYPDEIRSIKASEIFALSKHPEWMTPIPLTEEWLLKFGFGEWKEGEKCFYNGTFDWMLNPYKQYWHFYAHNEVGGKTWFLKDIQYIHQLQNLYFALTGEELIFKL